MLQIIVRIELEDIHTESVHADSINIAREARAYDADAPRVLSATTAEAVEIAKAALEAR